jgi:hypothetical protein
MKNEHFDGHWWAKALLDWQRRARPHDAKPLTEDGKLTELGRSWVHARIVDRHGHHETLETQAEEAAVKSKAEIEAARAEHDRVHADEESTLKARDWARRVHDTAVAAHEEHSKAHGDAFVRRFHLEALGGPEVLHDDFCSSIEQEIVEMVTAESASAVPAEETV